jgi:TM2 domain-containing membrane protein YozV
VSAPDLAGAAAAPALAPAVVAPAPPPPGGSINPDTGVDELRRVASQVVPSMFSTFGGYEATSSEPQAEVPAEPKRRTTFIVLGALLGPFGAHNFYAGYTKKGVIQLLITALTLGFASPMSWIWAIIDICTIDRDSKGVEFES